MVLVDIDPGVVLPPDLAWVVRHIPSPCPRSWCNSRTRMAYGDARIPARERNAAGPPCENRMGLLLPLVAALFGLALAAYIVLALPAWAALCIALGAVLRSEERRVGKECRSR